MQELILPEKIKEKIDDHVDASGKRRLGLLTYGIPEKIDLVAGFFFFSKNIFPGIIY
jgi:hypothetical protein